MSEMSIVKFLVFDKLVGTGFKIVYVILCRLEYFAGVGNARSFMLNTSVDSPLKHIWAIYVDLLQFVQNLILMFTTGWYFHSLLSSFLLANSLKPSIFLLILFQIAVLQDSVALPLPAACPNHIIHGHWFKLFCFGFVWNLSSSIHIAVGSRCGIQGVVKLVVPSGFWIEEWLLIFVEKILKQWGAHFEKLPGVERASLLVLGWVEPVFFWTSIHRD